MAKFWDITRNWDTRDRKIFDNFIVNWHTYARRKGKTNSCFNVYLEDSMDKKAFLDLVEFWISEIKKVNTSLNPNFVYSMSQIESVLAAVQNKIYSVFLLKGPRITSIRASEIKFIGHVRKLNTLREYWLTNHKKIFRLNKRKVKRVSENLDLYVNHTYYKDLLFNDKFKLIWVTWNDMNKTKEEIPFYFVSGPNRKAYTYPLGLSGFKLSEEIIILIFDFQKAGRRGFEIHKPTFADAFDQDQFRPTKEFEPYGWTVPLKEENPPLYNESQPEGVGEFGYIPLETIAKINQSNPQII